VLRPWALTGDTTRDNWRVGAISILFPWTYWRWRKIVPSLSQSHVNRDLKSSLDGRSQPPIVLTVGFKAVVTPLFAAMGLSGAPLFAARIFSLADRREGKLRRATRELGIDTVERSLVVTDSLDDMDLLAKCARPLRTRWAQALYRRAFSGIYLPGEYISRIKHPGERYILRAIIQEEFALWILSSIGLATNPVTHVLALALLLLSFWAIYERGYVDNDRIASRHETDPTLTAAFGTVSVASSAMSAWAWALIAGAVAVAILHSDMAGFGSGFSAWILLLIAMSACFRVYNRLDKKTRVWIYPFLQLARAAAFAVVVPIEAAGAAALGAHTLARWVPYMIYRHGSGQWPSAPVETTRLVMFVIFSALIACASGLSSVLTLPALCLLLWNIFRARSDIHALVASARRIDRSTAAPCAPPGSDD